MTYTPAARPLFWPLVPLYRLGIAINALRFRPGSPSVRRLHWPVVSVGNLSAGGAGKTPLAIALAKSLAARGLHVDILSRGYGRSSKLPLSVNPDGTAEEFGDEPLLIARETGVPVYVAAERYDAGQLAEKASPSISGVHILDDGFQHRRLHRDIDILLLSRADLADHLLPAGNLREPTTALIRAHVIAIPADEPDIADYARARGWNGEIWRLRRSMEIPGISGPVAAFCGIARPGQFFHGLEASGLELATRMAFPDHHRFTVLDLDRIAVATRKSGGNALLTTEKDRVRVGVLADALPPTLPLYSVALRTAIEDEHAAIDWLTSRLAATQAHVSRTLNSRL